MQPLLPGPSISFIWVATVILRKLGNPFYTRVGFVGLFGSPCLAKKVKIVKLLEVFPPDR